MSKLFNPSVLNENRYKWIEFIQCYSSPWATQSTLQRCLPSTHSCTSSYIEGGVNHAKEQQARLAQWWLGIRSGKPWHLAKLNKPSNSKTTDSMSWPTATQMLRILSWLWFNLQYGVWAAILMIIQHTLIMYFITRNRWANHVLCISIFQLRFLVWMVNGVHLYSAFIQSALQYCLTFADSCTVRVRCLAQGHLDTQTRRSGRSNSSLRLPAKPLWLLATIIPNNYV